MNALLPLPFQRLDVIDDPTPRDAALNMALDEALLDRIGDDPLLRIYRWAQPSVSIGCFEPCKPVVQQWPEHDLVRRWTGGGIVEHGDDLTFSLLVPRSMPLALMRPNASYQAVHAAIASAWINAGFLSDRLQFVDDPPAAAISRACFEKPVRHDLLVNGRKIVGGAQRRTRRGLLHQGSIQLGAKLRVALAAAMPATFAMSSRRRDLTVAEINAGQSLVKTKYGTHAWERRF